MLSFFGVCHMRHHGQNSIYEQKKWIALDTHIHFVLKLSTLKFNSFKCMMLFNFRQRKEKRKTCQNSSIEISTKNLHFNRLLGIMFRRKFPSGGFNFTNEKSHFCQFFYMIEIHWIRYNVCEADKKYRTVTASGSVIMSPCTMCEYDLFIFNHRLHIVLWFTQHAHTYTYTYVNEWIRWCLLPKIYRTSG